MATTNLPSYISSSDMRDVYPNIQRFDLKVPVHNFVGGESKWEAFNTGIANAVFVNGIECTSASAVEADFTGNDYEFYYTSASDRLRIILDVPNINNLTVEIGEDWATKLTDVCYKASRLFDSYIDKVLPKNQWLNEEESYDMIVVRTTAQIACYLLISAHEPTNTDAFQLKSEYEDVISRINRGDIKLHFEKSRDSSKGIIRKINANDATTLIPLDLRGTYTGRGFDKIRVEITTDGVIGTGTFSTWHKSNEKLGINKGTASFTDVIISGDYQKIGSGLEIRFGATTSLAGGEDQMNATVKDGDIYEIEVHGYAESSDDAKSLYSIEAVRK